MLKLLIKRRNYKLETSIRDLTRLQILYLAEIEVEEFEMAQQIRQPKGVISLESGMLKSELDEKLRILTGVLDERKPA